MKAQTTANRFKADAETFNIKPEILAAIEIERETRTLKSQVSLIAFGMDLDFDPTPLRSALDKVKQNVLGLEALLKERFGE